MKTAPWSLALVAAAGSAFATQTEEDCDESSAPAYESSSAYGGWGSSSVPAGYGSSSSAYPASSSAYPSSYGGYGSSSSYYAVSSSVPSGPYCVSTYTSTCEETSTLIWRSSTSTTLTTITHTLTTTLDGECPASSVPVAYPSSSVPASVPVPYPSSSVPVPASESYPAPSGSYPVASESYPAPSGSYPVASESYPAGHPSGPVIVTHTNFETTTVCPCEGGAKPTRTPGEVYTTETVTEYTTTCPGTGKTKTYTYGDWTSIYTSYEISTVTDTQTVTITEPYPVSSDGGVPSGPAGYPSIPWGGEGSSSGGAVPSSYEGGYGSSGYPSGYGSSAYASGSSAYPSGYGSSAYPSGSSAYPSGYGSSAWASGSSAYPSGYGSSAYPSGSSAYPSGYGSSAYPSGSSVYPSGSSVYPSSSWASSASSAYPTGTSGCTPCEGQPGKNPEEWCGYDIHDNWYDVVPKTCKTVEYHFTLTQEEVAPDGVSRPAFLVNGQMPGPMIEANWGDTVIVHFTNNLPLDAHNGTSLHFHGIRQNGTNEMDGVSSITQCPIAPGSSYTYKWTANSYGSSWWHSHYALQTYEGVFGPLIIHGPAALEYDDEQMVMVQDWNHATVDSLYLPSQFVTSPSSGPQTLDTGLINGMNVWQGSGQRFEMTVESGKSYRLRLVNTAIQSTFVFYVDGHTFQVIAMDFVPIVPYETDKVVINIGQRYDLIMKADQPSGDYWMRSDNQQPCGQLINFNDIKGIVHYADGPNGEPTSQPYVYPPTCLDEPYEKLVPIVPWSAGAQSTTIDESVVIAPNGGNPNLFKWTLSGTTFYAEWEHPTLKQIVDDGTIPTTSGNLAIEVPNLGEWVYVIIETVIPLPHPIHLHGHDFLILAQGLGVYNEGVPLNLDNPPRRDVANMPADPTNGTPGYLVLAFYTSNPGVWLLHCHIGWHNAMGFALQIIENLDGIADTVDNAGQIADTCAAWTNYANAYNVFSAPYDSGV